MPASCCANDAQAIELVCQEIQLQLKEGMLKKAIMSRLDGHKQPRFALSGLNRKKVTSGPVLLRQSSRSAMGGANPHRLKRGTVERTRK